jgi:hypothetical protein
VLDHWMNKMRGRSPLATSAAIWRRWAQLVICKSELPAVNNS